MDFPCGRVVKNLTANEGDSRDMGLIPGLGRSSGVGKGNLFQYSCLENSMDRKPGGLRSLGWQIVKAHTPPNKINYIMLNDSHLIKNIKN